MNAVNHSSKLLRENYNVVAVGNPAGVIHPECRTEDEIRLTSMFYGSHNCPKEYCDRCGELLHQN